MHGSACPGVSMRVCVKVEKVSCICARVRLCVCVWCALFPRLVVHFHLSTFFRFSSRLWNIDCLNVTGEWKPIKADKTGTTGY